MNIQETISHDPLAHLSRLAQSNPAFMRPILRALMASLVWVDGKVIAPFKDGEFVDLSKTVVLDSMTSEDATFIAFYSDSKALEAVMHTSPPHIHIPARMLFENTPGAHLLFN